ncbi:MAG TPA: MFS transporter, partial [Bradyrhizobium sp.]
MTEASVAGSERATATCADAVATKVFWRLLPFLFVLYVVAYLDRINIGFGALSMNKELGLTATMFGLSNTIFYAG